MRKPLKRADSSIDTALWQDGDRCKDCRKAFNFWNRKHHCRACGGVVCGACSGHLKDLGGGSMQRVCNPCYYKEFLQSSPVSFTETREEDSNDKKGNKRPYTTLPVPLKTKRSAEEEHSRSWSNFSYTSPPSKTSLLSIVNTSPVNTLTVNTSQSVPSHLSGHVPCNPTSKQRAIGPAEEGCVNMNEDTEKRKGTRQEVCGDEEEQKGGENGESEEEVVVVSTSESSQELYSSHFLSPSLPLQQLLDAQEEEEDKENSKKEEEEVKEEEEEKREEESLSEDEPPSPSFLPSSSSPSLFPLLRCHSYEFFSLLYFGLVDSLHFKYFWITYQRSVAIRSRFRDCFILNGVLILFVYFVYSSFISSHIHSLLNWKLHTPFNAAIVTLVEFFLNICFWCVWMIPMYILSIILNALWYEGVANGSYHLYVYHTRNTHHHLKPKGLNVILTELIYRNLVFAAFIAIAFLFYWIPYVGGVIYFLSLCLIYSVYCHEYKWKNKGWELQKILSYFETRWLYFIGFGTPMTLLSFFFDYMISYAVISLMFLIFIPISFYGTTRQQKYWPHIPFLKYFDMYFSSLLKALGRS